MKNFRWVLFFGVALILLLTFQVQAQEVAAATKTGLMAKVWVWLLSQGQGVLTGFVIAFAVKKGWTLAIKHVANKGAMITKELGELMTDSSVFLSVIDKSIKDDGTVEENTVPEMIAAGKEVVAELKDVVISIKPK
jgi:regulator of protease activity HflC (stomatin/prohibitin superfamily)